MKFLFWGLLQDIVAFDRSGVSAEYKYIFDVSLHLRCLFQKATTVSELARKTLCNALQEICFPAFVFFFFLHGTKMK